MNIKALIKAMLLRKFTTGLLLVQLAITLGLLVNTMLLTSDAIAKITAPVGFNADNLIVVSLLPTSSAYRDSLYYQSITEDDMRKLSELNGVQSVSYYNQLPIPSDEALGNVQDIDFKGILQRDLQMVPIVNSSHLAFSTLGIEIIAGRALKSEDNATQSSGKPYERNIVVTEALAKALYPDKAALNRLTNMGRIVGIAKDYMVNPKWQGRSKHFALYANVMETATDSLQNYVLKVAPGSLQQVMDKVEKTILAVQPERNIMAMYTMKQRMDRIFSREAGLAKLFVLLSLLMVLVTVISTFAHAHFHISQQRKYIGIRRALGARKKDIMLYVFSENWLINLLACLLGVIATIAINIMLGKVIIIDKPDVILYLVAVAVLFVCGTLATWLPAFKTTRVSPLVATQTV